MSLQASYFQGVGSAVTLAPGPVAVGQVYTPRGVPSAQGQYSAAPTPFASSYVAPSPLGTIGVIYTVTALLPDLTGNIGDQVTFSTLGTIQTSAMTQLQRLV